MSALVPSTDPLAHQRAAVAAGQRKRLYSMALMVLRHREDAEDIASEAISRAITSELDPQALPAWLTTTTKRLIVDEVRRRDRRRSLVSRLGGLRPEEVDDVIDLRLDNAEAAWLSAVVCRLPERQRHALELLAGASDIAAVAETMGVSYKAAEHLLARARATVRASARATWALLVLYSGSRFMRRSVAIPAAGIIVTASIALLVHTEHDRRGQLDQPPAGGQVTHATATGGRTSTHDPLLGGEGLHHGGNFSDPYRVREQSGDAKTPYFINTGGQDDVLGVEGSNLRTYDRPDDPDDPVLLVWRGCVQGLRVDPYGTGYIGCGEEPSPRGDERAQPLLGNRVPDLPLYPQGGVVHPPPRSAI